MPPIPTTMKCVKLTKLVGRYSEGDDAVRACFTVETNEPVPKPKWGEVLVRVERAQINPSDTSMCQGRYGVKLDVPFIPGFEGAGVVVASGGGLMAWRLMHKRVCMFTRKAGTWAEYVCVDAMRCLAVGDDVEWKNAAGGMANPLTVMAMIHECEQKGHKSIVVTAAASSISRQLIRVAKRHGIQSIAVVRKAEQLEQCAKDGAVEALDSSAEGFEAKLTEACKKLECRAAFDSVAGDTGAQVLASLCDGGEVYVYGFLSGKPIPATGAQLIFKNKSLRGFNMQHVLRLGWIKLWLITSELVSLLPTDLSTDVRETFPLDRVPDALLAYTKNMSGGKVQIQCNASSPASPDAVAQP